MTVTCLMSVKGAPGVTTLACLIGATWPEGRRVAVVEADHFGGDLAARFQLSTTLGWASFVTASRRSNEVVSLPPHLQALPGGLEVLVLPNGSQPAPSALSADALLRSCESSEEDSWDLLVDGGRLVDRRTAVDATGERHQSSDPWLDRSDAVIIVSRRDPASILKVRDHGRVLRERCRDRVQLVLVGRGPHDARSIEAFTGIAVIGEVPFDGAAAQVVTGEGGSARHLSRSLLVASASRLAATLAGAGDTRRSTGAGRWNDSRAGHRLRPILRWRRPVRTVEVGQGDCVPASAPSAGSTPTVAADGADHNAGEAAPDGSRQGVMS